MTRILVVDDEPNITDLVATALRYEGFDVSVGRAHVFYPGAEVGSTGAVHTRTGRPFLGR